jgi:hypothetical protein
MAYNPGIQHRGAEMLFAGITGGADALAEGVETWQKNKQEGQFLDEQAEQIAQLLAQGANQGPLQEADLEVMNEIAGFPSLSLSQKRGKLAGLMFTAQQRQQAAAAQADERRHSERMGVDMAGLELRRGEMMQKSRAADQQAESEAARQRDTIGMIYGMTNPGSLPGPVDPQNPGPYLQSQYPNADAELIAKMIGETTQRNREPVATKLGGRDVVFSPHTGAFQIVPPGPVEGELQAQLVTGEDGTVLGYGIPSGRGGITFRARTAERPPDGTPVPGLETTHVYVNGRAVKRDAAGELMKSITGDRGNKPASKADLDPMGLFK